MTWQYLDEALLASLRLLCVFSSKVWGGAELFPHLRKSKGCQRHDAQTPVVKNWKDPGENRDSLAQLTRTVGLYFGTNSRLKPLRTTWGGDADLSHRKVFRCFISTNTCSTNQELFLVGRSRIGFGGRQVKNKDARVFMGSMASAEAKRPRQFQIICSSRSYEAQAPFDTVPSIGKR